MANFLSKLAFAVLILGIIGSIILAKQLGVKVEARETGYTYKSIEYVEVRDGALTAGIFFGSAFSTVIIFAVLIGLSTVLDRLDYQDKKIIEIMGKLEKDKIKPNIPAERSSDIPEKSGAWKCPHCGTVNGANANKCWCGQKKEDN